MSLEIERVRVLTPTTSFDLLPDIFPYFPYSLRHQKKVSRRPHRRDKNRSIKNWNPAKNLALAPL